MIYATYVSTYYVAYKKAILYVCCRSRNRAVRLGVAVSHSSDSLTQSERCSRYNLRPIYTRRYSCGISRGIAHLSNQRTFVYFCVTPERYRAGSLPERYSCGIPQASRPLDQSALLFCCCHATAGDGACR